MSKLRNLLIFLVLFWPVHASSEDLPGTLSIETAEGERLFVVEIADTPETRAQGLMNRTFMPRDKGMLFDFKAEQPVSFWMKNTLIPLDMLFASSDGVIVHIFANARPGDESPIRSGAPVLAVLEINGGMAEELGIRPGDRMKHPIFARE